MTDKILSFDFYPEAVCFECKFWILRSAFTQLMFKTDRLDLRGLDLGKNDVAYSLASNFSV